MFQRCLLPPSSLLCVWNWKELTQQKPLHSGRAIAHAVSRRLLTAEDRARAHVSREICGGQSGTETGSSVFPCQYNSTAALYSFIYRMGQRYLTILTIPLKIINYQEKCGTNFIWWVHRHRFFFIQSSYFNVGTLCCTENIYLDATLPNRWVSRDGPLAWPPRSSDITSRLLSVGLC
jgi:hypothetical protein